MASKKHRPEEAVAKLRQAYVLVSQGQSVAEAIRAIGVTEVTYYPALFTLPRENRRLIPFRSAGLVRVAQGGRDSLRRVAQATTPELGGRRSARGRSAAGHGAARFGCAELSACGVAVAIGRMVALGRRCGVRCRARGSARSGARGWPSAGRRSRR